LIAEIKIHGKTDVKRDIFQGLKDFFILVAFTNNSAISESASLPRQEGSKSICPG
jgi:hypothetical protein